MNDKVGAIVCTYNPEISALRATLSSISDNVDCVVVVDDCSRFQIFNKIAEVSLLFPNVSIIRNSKNMGIASSQNIGIAELMSLNVDIFFESDQDSIFSDDYFKNLIDRLKEYPDAAIGGVAVGLDGFVHHRRMPNNGLISVDRTLSSGMGYKKEFLLKTGDKYDPLFIDLVDWEWCWRARKKGLRIFVDTNLAFKHSLGDGGKLVLGFRFGIPAPFRHYYQFRNSLILFRMGYVPFLWKLKSLMLLIFKPVVYYLFFDNGPCRLNYCARGLFHGLIGRVGSIEEQ
jgi:rhamnosyltransferase